MIVYTIFKFQFNFGTLFKVTFEEQASCSSPITLGEPVAKKSRISNVGGTELLSHSVPHIDGVDDEPEMIGKIWASQYRQLSPEQQLYAKKQIDDILYYGRLSKLSPGVAEEF